MSCSSPTTAICTARTVCFSRPTHARKPYRRQEMDARVVRLVPPKSLASHYSRCAGPPAGYTKQPNSEPGLRHSVVEAKKERAACSSEGRLLSAYLLVAVLGVCSAAVWVLRTPPAATAMECQVRDAPPPGSISNLLGQRLIPGAIELPRDRFSVRWDRIALFRVTPVNVPRGRDRSVHSHGPVSTRTNWNSV